eukprot:5042496-Prymnesium_polylepis.2
MCTCLRSLRSGAALPERVGTAESDSFALGESTGYAHLRVRQPLLHSVARHERREGLRHHRRVCGT